MPRRLLLPALLAALAACDDDPAAPGEVCAREDAAARPDVSGVFRYEGDNPFLLRGTITFEQEGSLVRVTETTYANAFDRPLVGEAQLVGNRLAIELVPENGDTDYRADVVFLFGADGSTFCVEFSDTNGDAGPLGTYTGRRETP